MKIALLGYGKMGKIIESIALSRQHQIVLKIDKDNQHELTVENLQQADVAIEFSTPGTVLDNINTCLEAGVPVVVGTTGWHNMLASVQQKCEDTEGTVLYGTNFSVGVNIFFHVNNSHHFSHLVGFIRTSPVKYPAAVKTYFAHIKRLHHFFKIMKG